MRSRHNRGDVGKIVAARSCPGRAAACNAAAQSRDPESDTASGEMGPGSAAHRRRALRCVRGTRGVYRTGVSTSSLRAQRSNTEYHSGKTLDCFAALAMTEQGAASHSPTFTCRMGRAKRNPSVLLSRRRYDGFRKCSTHPTTLRTHLRLLAAHFARVLLSIHTPSIERAQGRPGAGWHPRSAARNVAQKDRAAAYRCSRTHGLPCAVVGRRMPCSPGSRVPSGLPRACEIRRHRAG
jgi:hypothetical protein